RVVQLESPLERLSDCRTVPYLRFFLVRNEEVAGSIPVSSTKLSLLCESRMVHPAFGVMRLLLRFALGEKAARPWAGFSRREVYFGRPVRGGLASICKVRLRCSQ